VNAESEKALETLLAKLPGEARGDLIRLGDRWQVESLLKQTAKLVQDLMKTIQDPKAPETARIAAALQAVDFGKKDAALAKTLLGLITPQTSPDFASGLMEALGKSEAQVGNEIITAMSGWSPSGRNQALRLLAQRTAWTPALLDACEKGLVRLTDLPLDQQRSMADHPDRKIAGRARTLLESGGSLPSADRQKVIHQLEGVTKKAGDVPHGKAVYLQHCAKCHLHNGVTGPGVPPGGIGPELSGMAAHPKEELLIHIMDPSRGVEGNFRAWTVVTTRGQIINGLMNSETKTSLELVDAEGKKYVLNRSDIEEISVSAKSLMPEGFEKQINEKDLSDLLEFMTQRGKFLALPLDKVATVATDRGMFFGPESEGDRMIFDDWKPKTFAGVPFALIDPKGGTKPNAIMLFGTNGVTPPKMPKQVSMTVGGNVRAVHLLSGVGGWNYPAIPKGSTSMIVRLVYEDGSKEDHPLKNGEHFSDYIRRVDVPDSKFAFDLQGKQIRYLSVVPKKQAPLKAIEFVKGRDISAPVVMAVTIESP
jgi:putative heme-binding domain-containing protein